MVLFVYNENCVRAGAVAVEYCDDEEAGRACGDVTVYEGTEQELLTNATKDLRRLQTTGARGTYWRRVARSIISSVHTNGDRIVAAIEKDA